MIDLYKHQKEAVDKLRPGSILVGGVGSGKSRTALAYYFNNEKPKDLYIITTARKRDELDWQKECIPFHIFSDKELNIDGINLVVDSWNNINKYKNVKNSFFIFDEQRLVGSGVWAKSFLKIANTNTWILLTATPGDNWMDFVSVFIANGFYKNRTEFIRQHVVYSNFSKFPKIIRYMEVSKLIRLRNEIVVDMKFDRQTISHEKTIITNFDKELLNRVVADRWNVYENRPIKDVTEVCYLMRKVVNSDPDRTSCLLGLFKQHPKIIVFYNFNCEKDILLKFGQDFQITTAQWNGHKHEFIPKTNSWMYIVQYSAGAEGWNCIETDTLVFFSQSYSYKQMIQSAGRIDRLNTPFRDLYYYYFRSNSSIDLAINEALRNKKNFNESQFLSI